MGFLNHVFGLLGKAFDENGQIYGGMTGAHKVAMNPDDELNDSTSWHYHSAMYRDRVGQAAGADIPGGRSFITSDDDPRNWDIEFQAD